jgi:cytochrome P450
MVLGGFSGTAANYDYRQYRELENEIKKYKSAIDTFKERNPDKYDEYADKYPGRISAVEYFDEAKNGELKKLQSEAKKMDELPPKERQEALKENRKEQNAVLREIIETTRDILSE